MKRFLFFFGLLFSIQSIGQVYILNEDFSTAGGIIPPLEWINNPISGNANDKWHFDNPGNKIVNNPMTAPFTIFDAGNISGDGNPEVVSLESPFFDASIGKYTLLFFDHVFQSGNGARGKILAFNGTSWEDVKIFNSSTENPRHEVIDLTAICAGKTKAKIRFQWEGNGEGFWAIDNIKIFAPLFLDAGITTLNFPEMPFNSGKQVVKVTLNNNGYAILNQVTINWSVNDIKQSPFDWKGSIQHGTSQPSVEIGSYIFPPGLPVRLKVWTDFPNGNQDLNPYNDTIVYNLSSKFCGNYTIAGESSNFKSFNEAIGILTNAGVSCPVVFKVRDGNYPEQVEINPIPGSSVINTVTFESESGDSSKVIVSNPNSGRPTMTLDGAKNVIIRKLGFLMNGYGATSMSIENKSENIIVENCDMSNTWYALGVGISGGSRDVVIRNSFLHAGYGNHRVYVTDAEEVTITGNRMEVDWEAAIYGHSGVNNLTISHNDIYESGSPGIRLNLTSDSVYILGNRIHKGSIEVVSNNENGWCVIENNRIISSASSGIILSTKRCRVANNYITISGINPYWGIQVSDSHNTSIIFNTVHVLNSNIGSSGIWVAGGTSLDIRNNIFSNIGGGYCAYIANMPLSGIWDYNNYHNLYQRTGFLNGQTYPAFTSWYGAISGESHGLSCNPFFTNDSTLVPHQILLNNAGIMIPGVVSDIDGVKRDPVTPDTGASEFSPCVNDAGVNAVTFPSTPANSGNQDVRVLLQNQGTNTLGSVRIDWSVNGVVQNSFNWTGSLGSRKNTEIKIGTVSLQPGVIYNIKAWTSGPNGIKDCDQYNDTVMSPRIFTKLCGTYTIGGINPNFRTINEAVHVLTDAGISCPVVFKVRDGSYLEQVEINPIPGSSVINTVTFESESGDSSKVTLSNNAGPALKTNGAKNIFIHYYPTNM